MDLSLYAFIILAMSSSAAAGVPYGAGYAMYVWTTGFDRHVAGKYPCLIGLNTSCLFWFSLHEFTRSIKYINDHHKCVFL